MDVRSNVLCTYSRRRSVRHNLQLVTEPLPWKRPGRTGESMLSQSSLLATVYCLTVLVAVSMYSIMVERDLQYSRVATTRPLSSVMNSDFSRPAAVLFTDHVLITTHCPLTYYIPTTLLYFYFVRVLYSILNSSNPLSNLLLRALRNCLILKTQL